MKRILLIIAILLLACLLTLRLRVCKMLRLNCSNNCFTWVLDNFDWDGGDGLLLVKSLSGEFPHVTKIHGVRTLDRQILVLSEFIPVKRVHQPFPPITFEGKENVEVYEKVTGDTNVEI